MNARPYCSEENTDEQMLGTADEVDLWLLLEYRARWRAKALTDNELARSTQDWLAEGVRALAAQGRKVRVQFIRQPEREAMDVRLLIHADGVLRTFSSGADGYRGLTATPIAELAATASGERLRAPHYFVCTNGQRDLCCARFGLPVHQRLRELVGERVWQSTHLGGHRFAPNLLVLPQGALYGRVRTRKDTTQTAAVDELVRRVEAGELSIAYLRGRTCYPKPVQAAEGFAGGGNLVLVDVQGDERRAEVTFARDGKHLSISVARAEAPLRVLATCGDAELKEAHPYVALAKSSGSTASIC